MMPVQTGRRVTINDMRQSPEGSQLLSLLAAAVVDMFIPIVGAARARYWLLSDWLLWRK
jgi:hypothetical protein